MEHLRPDSTYEELRETFAHYRGLFGFHKGKDPPDVYNFASATWHYDAGDHRSLHDSWLEELVISEEPLTTEQERSVIIKVRLLGPFHDGHTSLIYTGVRRYRLDWMPEPESTYPSAHGDWLLDEIRLSSSGAIVHEVLFSSGAKWIIECSSIRHSTTIPAVRS